MSEILNPQPEFDEVLSRFPELARARNLFIELFKDIYPLINLGYTSRQIEFAFPVLRLLEEEGEVIYYMRKPYLNFKDPREPWAEDLQIYHLPSRQGFSLQAMRAESLRGLGKLSKSERLEQVLFGQPNPVIIFSDFDVEVAHIGLFKETAPINNLDYLIRELYDYFTNAPLGMREESKLTKFARAFGITGTYETAWVDEATKSEFVAKLDAPEDRKPGSAYVAYRRLEPVSDSQGTLVPFGKKADVSESKVTKILSVQKKQVVSGHLAWDKVGI